MTSAMAKARPRGAAAVRDGAPRQTLVTYEEVR